jgi:hypothetical protein
MKLTVTYASMCLMSVGLVACGAKNGAIDATRGTPTSKVVATVSGKTIKLPFAIFEQSTTDLGPKKFALALTDYDQCVWAGSHDPSLLPKNTALLGLYLLDENGGTLNQPTPGTYQVQSPDAAATGTFIDPKTSGFGVITNCVGNWPGLMSGTVTITQINNGVIAGSVSLLLTDGSQISGNFSTETCTNSFATNPPANDPDACVSVK